jgi:hypothetical protein
MAHGFLADTHDGHRFGRALTVLLMQCSMHGASACPPESPVAPSSELLNMLMCAWPSPRCATFVSACCCIAVLLVPHLVPRKHLLASMPPCQLVPALLLDHLTNPSDTSQYEQSAAAQDMLADRACVWLRETLSEACPPLNLLCVCLLCLIAKVDPLALASQSPTCTQHGSVASVIKHQILILASARYIAQASQPCTPPGCRLHSLLVSLLVQCPTAHACVPAWAHIRDCECCSKALVSAMTAQPPRSLTEASASLCALERLAASEQIVSLISAWFIEDGAPWLPLRTPAVHALRTLQQDRSDMSEHVDACMHACAERRIQHVFPAPKAWTGPSGPPYSLGHVVRSPPWSWRPNTRGALLAFLLLRKKQLGSVLPGVPISDVAMCLAFLRRQYAWVARAGVTSKLSAMLQVGASLPSTHICQSLSAFPLVVYVEYSSSLMQSAQEQCRSLRNVCFVDTRAVPTMH